MNDRESFREGLNSSGEDALHGQKVGQGSGTRPCPAAELRAPVTLSLFAHAGGSPREAIDSCGGGLAGPELPDGEDRQTYQSRQEDELLHGSLRYMTATDQVVSAPRSRNAKRA